MRLRRGGAVAVGFAEAGRVPAEVDRQYSEWLGKGYHSGMTWMERHRELRRDPENVLPGVKTVISIAYPYSPGAGKGLRAPYVARYAYSEDYHLSARKMVSEALGEPCGYQWRICIDSAPLPERFWAVKAGIGFIGDNGALIVPGIGPEVVLAEILTTAEYPPDSPLSMECLHCGRCLGACPSGALRADATIDCRRCISYLTIEHRGPWTDPAAIEAMNTPRGRDTLFGCDCCLAVCPLCDGNTLSALPPADVPPLPLPPSERLLEKLYPRSSLLRARRKGLLRNLRLDTDDSAVQER